MGSREIVRKEVEERNLTPGCKSVVDLEGGQRRREVIGIGDVGRQTDSWIQWASLMMSRFL